MRRSFSIRYSLYYLILMVVMLASGSDESFSGEPSSSEPVATEPINITHEEKSRLNLTEAERAWLSKHKKIRVGGESNWAPFEYFDIEGEYQGLFSSYMEMIGERTGLEINAVDCITFNKVLNKLQAKQIDMSPGMVKSEKRMEYLNFSKPHTIFPMVVIMRKDAPFVKGIADLYGSRIATVKGYITEKLLQNDYPKLFYLGFDSVDEALSALSRGEADAFIGNKAAVHYSARKLGLDNLAVAATTDYRFELSFGVRKDWPEFIAILNKFIDSISPEEKRAIEQNWLNLRVQKQFDWHATLRWGIIISSVFIVLLSISFFWNRRLVNEIEKRKKVEASLKEAKEASEAANRAKSEFLAAMSHELRTPLNAILGFSQTMLRDQDLPPRHGDRLEVVNRSGEHLLALINDVLEMSKIETGQTALSAQDFDLLELLDVLRSMFVARAEAKGLTLDFKISSDCPRFVHTDPQKMRQVLFNLLSNAVKFTEKGNVTLRASYQEGRLSVEVEDTGVGIAARDMKRIFDPFVQAEAGRQSHEGTGLGLALCQRFVSSMDGRIRCSSTPGVGSTFSFEVPAPAAQKRDVAPAPPDRRVIGLEPGQTDFRILIVEDHADSRMLLTDLLQAAGFQVETAANGKEAVDIDADWRPHLIWMDIGMPVMDGLEATRRIKEGAHGAGTKIIALTAHAFEEEREKAMAAGCDDFIRKPFHEEEIFRAMEEHLGARYIYEDRPSRSTKETAAFPDARALAALPPDWLLELRKSVKRLDPDAAMDVIAKIETRDRELAVGLGSLIDDFRFDILTRLLEENGK